MWVVYPPATGACGRPNKPRKVAEGEPPVRNPNFWIRPGSDYTAGRNDEQDIFLTHPKLSRTSVPFTLRASKVEPQDTLLAAERNVGRPSYELRIKARDNELVAIDEDGTQVTIRPESEYIIRDGLKIKAFEHKAKECILIFRWRPVHLYFRAAKKKDIPGLQEALAPLGITFNATCMNNKLPDITHTHAVFAKIQPSPHPIQLIAANYQLQFVRTEWVDKLLTNAQPLPKPAPPPADPGEDGAEPPKPKRQPAPKSALELDFDVYWPHEDRYFPPLEGREASDEEQNQWKPNVERRELFRNTLFIDCSGDPSVSPLVASAGGTPYMPNLDNLKDCLAFYERFLQAHGPASVSFKKYVITPLSPEFLSPERLAVVQQLYSPNIDGHVTPMHLFACVREVSSITQIKTSSTSASPAPTPTLPAATGDISFPATHPGDVPASAPPRPLQSVGQKRPVQIQEVTTDLATSTVAQSEGRPSKKPRKLGDRVNAIDNIFSGAVSPVLPSDAGENLQNAEASSLASSRATTKPVAAISESQSQSQSRTTRTEGKFSKLKRRVGQTNASQGSSLGELELPEESDEPPSKKFKSFDPDVASAISQISSRKDGEQKKPTPIIEEDEEEEEVKLKSKPPKASVASKSGASLPAAGADEDMAQNASQVVSRRKGGAALTAKEKKKAEQVAEAARTSQFLQVKTGRRKLGTEDAAFNDDFNRLHLRKTQIPEAHKMGWNERDVFQEEMSEDARWAPEDKSTFFQIRFVPMVRKKPAATTDSSAAFAGKTNFKAFRPKSSQGGPQSARTITPAVRAQVALVAEAMPGYGLRESYGEGTDDIGDGGNETEESVEMPMAGQATQRKNKAAAKSQGKASARSSRTASSKRAVVPAASDEEEASASSTAEEDSAPRTTARRAPAKESITIESSSDDEDQTRFKGFGTAAKITSRRR